MGQLDGRIAWVTGAGSGIGEAAALALAREGAAIVLTGRRAEALERNAARIRAAGGTAYVQPADLMRSDQVRRVGDFIGASLGRLDILVNNAGLNILDRHWNKLTLEGIDTLVGGNLTAALYCVSVALPMMRAQRDGLLIHTASMAGRFIGGFSGPIYTAAKHGLVAASHSINMEECVNGIRSSVVLPGEVATPILEQRPNPVSAEDKARMLQAEDCADLIRYIACLPARVVINEVMIAPSWNRGYVANLQRKL
ncbi:MAG: SDR family NAD(P)-dependent oxidoreductase [Rhodospirillales bacterium]|nr:SDR family NAD(P)-dependent oxidoreductase [Rhodospirillales bacterium]